MLLVKTKINKSRSHGIGLFADQFIKKGTKTWQYHPEFDSSFTPKQISKLPAFTRKRLLDFLYFDFEINKYILCCDDQRFINHSSKPNIKSKPSFDIALRNIEKGEELTCNYEDYEKDWFKNRGLDKKSFDSVR